MDRMGAVMDHLRAEHLPEICRNAVTGFTDYRDTSATGRPRRMCSPGSWQTAVRLQPVRRAPNPSSSSTLPCGQAAGWSASSGMMPCVLL